MRWLRAVSHLKREGKKIPHSRTHNDNLYFRMTGHMASFIHSFIHPCIHSYTHSFIQSFICVFCSSNSFDDSHSTILTAQFIYSLTCSISPLHLYSAHNIYFKMCLFKMCPKVFILRWNETSTMIFNNLIRTYSVKFHYRHVLACYSMGILC